VKPGTGFEKAITLTTGFREHYSEHVVFIEKTLLHRQVSRISITILGTHPLEWYPFIL